MADAKELLKTIGSDIRGAESRMFSRQFTEAVQLAAKVEEALAEVLRLEPQNAAALAHLTKLNKLKKDLAAKSPAVQPATVAGVGQDSVAPAAVALPAGVAKRLRDIQAALKNRDLEGARQFMKEIADGYGGKFDESHPQYAEAAAAIAAFQEARDRQCVQEQTAKAGGETARMEREAQSGEWAKRLRELAPFAYSSADVSDLVAQQKAFERAQKLFAEYQSTPFAAGKTEILDNLERELAQKIADFSAIFEKSRTALLENAQTHLRGRLQALAKDIEGKPAVMSAASLQECCDAVAVLQPLLDAGDAAGGELQALLQQLQQRDSRNRGDRAKLITIGEDVYRGSDATVLKEWAARLVTGVRPAPKIVRTVITAAEWKEVSQWEGQGDERRYVTRRETYAQVAARADGTPRLFFVYLTQERHQDGSWSGLAGNVMYTEAMVEENLMKENN